MRIWCFVSLAMMTVPAAAQPAPPASPRKPDQSPARIWREPPGPIEDGRLAMPVAGNLRVGVGRFSAAESARRRTHTEPIGRTTEMSRDRGVAAIGLSLRF